jgi:hypothetical protein
MEEQIAPQATELLEVVARLAFAESDIDTWAAAWIAPLNSVFHMASSAHRRRLMDLALPALVGIDKRVYEAILAQLLQLQNMPEAQVFLLVAAIRTARICGLEDPPTLANEIVTKLEVGVCVCVCVCVCVPLCVCVVVLSMF